MDQQVLPEGPGGVWRQVTGAAGSELQVQQGETVASGAA